MSAAVAILFTLLATVPVVDDAGADIDAPKAHSPRVVLEEALRNYDRAVAMPQQRGEEAVTLYRSALEGFRSVADQGVRNGHLFYNIANTHMRLGDVGRAIVNYRRAERLAPSDNDIRRNLAYARSLREVRIDPPASTAILRTLLFWHYEVSPAVRAAAAIGAYAGFWFLMFVMLFRKRRVPALVGFAVVLCISTAALGASVGWEMYAGDHEREGVIVARQAVLRKGNGDAYEPQINRPLPAGVEFRIIESRDGADGTVWRRVELPDGIDGWFRADQIEAI